MNKTIAGTVLAVCASTGLSLAEGVVIVEEIPDVQMQKTLNNIGFKAGTLGVGIEFSFPVSENFSLRINANGLSYDETEQSDDIEYTGTLQLSNIGLLGDYYPTDSSFRLTAGAYINNNQFEGRALPSSLIPIDLGNVSYGINDIGHLDTVVTFQPISPYIGIGFGNDTREKGWGFTLDIGAMYHGAPTAEVTADIKNQYLRPIIERELKEEKIDLEAKLADVQFFPVVMVGVNYTF
jgi:hypothetical protein